MPEIQTQNGPKPAVNPAFAPEGAQAAPKGKVLVDFTEKRLLVFHHPQSGSMISKLSDPKAVLTAEEALDEAKKAEPVYILPGVHPYHSDLWEIWKKHPLMKHLIADGKLVLQTKGDLGQKLQPGEDPKTPAAALPKSLQNIEISKALALSSGVMDQGLLETWLKDEQEQGRRQSLVDALQRQIDKIKETDAKIKSLNS